MLFLCFIPVSTVILLATVPPVCREHILKIIKQINYVTFLQHLTDKVSTLNIMYA